MAPTERRAEYPAEPASAREARRFVAATLRAWDYDEIAEIAVLLVSELVSNAILHAGTTIRVVVKRAGSGVRVEVHDRSGRGANRKHYSSMSTTGRGLLLVEDMSDEWGVVPDGGGKTVWFELSRPERRAQAGPLSGHRDMEGAGPMLASDTDPAPADARGGGRSSRARPRLTRV